MSSKGEKSAHPKKPEDRSEGHKAAPHKPHEERTDAPHKGGQHKTHEEHPDTRKAQPHQKNR